LRIKRRRKEKQNQQKRDLNQVDAYVSCGQVKKKKREAKDKKKVKSNVHSFLAFSFFVSMPITHSHESNPVFVKFFCLNLIIFKHLPNFFFI